MPGLAFSMEAVLAPTPVIQAFAAAAMNSGPWSERLCVGVPCARNRSTSASITSDDLCLRATRIASASCMNASTTQSIRTLRPSRVRSATKSWAQIWFARSG